MKSKISDIREIDVYQAQNLEVRILAIKEAIGIIEKYLEKPLKFDDFGLGEEINEFE